MDANSPQPDRSWAGSRAGRLTVWLPTLDDADLYLACLWPGRRAPAGLADAVLAYLTWMAELPLNSVDCGAR